MSLQELNHITAWCAAGVIWIGTQVLGAMLVKCKWWHRLLVIVCQFPILCCSQYVVDASMQNIQGLAIGMAVLPFALFGAIQFALCRRNWRRGIVASLVPIFIAAITVGISLSIHILLEPRVMGMLRYSVYDYSIPFHRTQIGVAAVAYGLSWLLLFKSTPMVFRRLVAVAWLVMGVGLGLFAMLHGAKISSELGTVSQTVILLSMMAVVLYLMAVFYILSRQKEASFEEQLLAEKNRFEETRHSDAQAIWENVRKVRHDMKQHLTILSGYLEDNEIEKCKEYLDDLLGNIDRMGNLLKSENRVLDYLINSKLCGLVDTEVVISGSIGDLSDIVDADLASIVGNLLDNAVEGVEKALEKRIELHFAMQNSTRILICKNTVEKSVLADNPGLRSTKGGGTHLGLGTHIIRELVAKYRGMIDFFEDHELFCVQIVLPMPTK